jgi:hypothetical protein
MSFINQLIGTFASSLLLLLLLLLLCCWLCNFLFVCKSFSRCWSSINDDLSYLANESFFFSFLFFFCWLFFFSASWHLYCITYNVFVY